MMSSAADAAVVVDSTGVHRMMPADGRSTAYVSAVIVVGAMLNEVRSRDVAALPVSSKMTMQSNVPVNDANSGSVPDSTSASPSAVSVGVTISARA